MVVLGPTPLCLAENMKCPMLEAGTFCTHINYYDHGSQNTDMVRLITAPYTRSGPAYGTKAVSIPSCTQTNTDRYSIDHL